MSTNGSKASVKQLQEVLNLGDIALVREILLRMPKEEQDQLRDELGERDFNQVYISARRLRRGKKKGRVILLNGIMGALLDVEKRRKVQRVWTNYWRFFSGRLADLELNLNGGPARDDVLVRAVGLHRKYYLPMLLELDREWHVKPFAYDWREDIAKSAHRLAEEVKTFGNGEPVHLVGHSMGGLVSRCFISLYPELWKSMADPNGLEKGGRLVMLGTPNHGSYAIPLALSGGEKLVKILALLDRKHDLRELLGILNTFPGSYQMLPSPLVDLPDDHAELFKRDKWGSLPIHESLLDKATDFHRSIASVVDPERFTYVAGYDRETPFRIRIGSAGRFTYQHTQEGDGRVPHELGLLDGVSTYWVDATHGDLARSSDVRQAIHDLLSQGKTGVLASTRPATRAVAPAEEWRSHDEFENTPEELTKLLENETRSAGARNSRLTPRDQLRVENLMLEDYLGAPARVEKPKDIESGKKGPRIKKLKIEVLWGDITKVKGDVYCVGHYQGVYPQKAEWALDCAVSETTDSERHVIRQHTLRGMLKGNLGDVDFFPWRNPRGKPRTVAVAGMGRPGTFSSERLRVLSRKLSWALYGLPHAETVCTVLIGSGEGSLSIRESVRGLAQGFADTLRNEKNVKIKTLRFVELYRHRALEILDALKDVTKHSEVDLLVFEVDSEIHDLGSGRVAEEDALELLVHAAINEYGTTRKTTTRQAGDDLLRKATRGNKSLEKRARTVLQKLGTTKSDEKKSFIVRRRSRDSATQQHPTRISFVRDGETVRVAAISESTTVSERILRFDPRLVHEVVAEVNDPERASKMDVSDFLTRLLLPADFRELWRSSSMFVFELDREMAQVHWEMLLKDVDQPEAIPLGVGCRVSRQLRTTYSPAPLLSRKPPGELKALVVGDPGDPNKGHNLPGAMEEALQVRDFLLSHGVEVVARIGAPNVLRTGKLSGIEPASRAEVLHLLMKGGIDILHYAGHGDFDAEDPERAGWLFSGGLLTALELERIDAAPSVVIANACLSARTSQATANGQEASDRPRETMLLPSLADEFFHRGVRNYIGTAWEVSDIGAILFAKELYKQLLGENANIGDAVQTARRRLYDERRLYGNLWAAYQHYGDPTSPLKSQR